MGPLTSKSCFVTFVDCLTRSVFGRSTALMFGLSLPKRLAAGGFWTFRSRAVTALGVLDATVRLKASN
ncbi:hypothetical protein D3867_26220 (plasmid) [Azospirillum argentinense]|uniref:Uncharacterized protein n=1 Tax=Azospirillum brasilense TaxID=192 RepID=A0A4D8Q5P1_AZOBR|nr:hypothetical protein D3867_26220 [Azospirillum argentinense]